MNLYLRVVTWWKMFAHQMNQVSNGNWHIEACHTRGFRLLGVYIPLVFVERHCHTCGYLSEQAKESA